MGDHQGRDLADGEEGADQVDPQDLLPGIDGELEEGCQAAGNAGVGIDRVDAAELGHRAGDIGLHVGLAAGIRRHGDGGRARRANLLRHRLHRLGAAVDEEDGRALAREEAGARPADAAGRARDDGALAPEPAHAVLPRPCVVGPVYGVRS